MVVFERLIYHFTWRASWGAETNGSRVLWYKLNYLVNKSSSKPCDLKDWMLFPTQKIKTCYTNGLWSAQELNINGEYKFRRKKKQEKILISLSISVCVNCFSNLYVIFYELKLRSLLYKMGKVILYMPHKEPCHGLSLQIHGNTFFHI